MRKLSLSLSTLVSLAGAAATKNKSRTTQAGRSYRRIGNGYRYPEQSSRQSMRIHRRAQGGPGIYLAGDNRYHAVF